MTTRGQLRVIRAQLRVIKHGLILLILQKLYRSLDRSLINTQIHYANARINLGNRMIEETLAGTL